jgi:hypothetical protein
MKIIFSPQRADFQTIIVVDGDKLTVTVDGQTDVFDFTGMPNGKAGAISSDLTYNPVISAERVDGELIVNMINWYGAEPIKPQVTLDEPRLEQLARGEDETEEEFELRVKDQELAYADVMTAYHIEMDELQAAIDDQFDKDHANWYAQTQVYEVIY